MKRCGVLASLTSFIITFLSAALKITDWSWCQQPAHRQHAKFVKQTHRIPSIIIDVMSGGVMSAAITNAPTIAKRRPLRSLSRSTMPTVAKMTTATGTSKHNPNAKNMARRIA